MTELLLAATEGVRADLVQRMGKDFIEALNPLVKANSSSLTEVIRVAWDAWAELDVMALSTMRMLTQDSQDHNI